MRKRILLVEDDEDSRSILATLFRKFGYETIEADSGSLAIEKALSEKPDIIMMDIGLPGMSGLDATRVIKQDPGIGQIPIIAYTALSPQPWKTEAFRIGIVDYLQKPVSLEAIIETVERHLAAARSITSV